MTEESAKLRMNLVAIQNVDPYAKEILDSSPHVAYYKFVNNEWEKSEIEGKDEKISQFPAFLMRFHLQAHSLCILALLSRSTAFSSTTD